MGGAKQKNPSNRSIRGSSIGFLHTRRDDSCIPWAYLHDARRKRPIINHNPRQHIHLTMIKKAVLQYFLSICLLLSFTTACNLLDCDGVNLQAGIDRDMSPWKERGGITREDVEAAQSWRVHSNKHTKSTNDGYFRITSGFSLPLSTKP